MSTKIAMKFFRKLEELLMKDITRKYFLLKVLVKSGKS